MERPVENTDSLVVSKRNYFAPKLQVFGAVKDLTATGSRAVPEPDLPPDANPHDGMV